MRDAKMKLKNAAILRNITQLKLKQDNDTRWSGKYEILQRFQVMRNYLVEASEHSNSGLKVEE